jgi:hypothetical protein
MTNRAPERDFAENLRAEAFHAHASVVPVACSAI